MAGYALPVETDEYDVLVSWQRDEHDGLDLLYRRYALPLTEFCERRLGNRAEAEDAAHEAILKAYKAMPRFRQGARLWPWLSTIAANICRDALRARDRWSDNAAEEQLGGEVDEDAERRVRSRILCAAIDELPERFRTPLMLREFMGWSYDDIATFSGKTIGSVRTTLMRARRALQARVEDVARRQGQWPLPIAVAARWRRVRVVLREWRQSAHDRATRLFGGSWQTDGLMSLASGGIQAVLAGIAATATLAALPAGASTTMADGGRRSASSLSAEPAQLAMGAARVAAIASRTSSPTSDGGRVAATVAAPSGPPPAQHLGTGRGTSSGTPAGPIDSSTRADMAHRPNDYRVTVSVMVTPPGSSQEYGYYDSTATNCGSDPNAMTIDCQVVNMLPPQPGT
jgi:RNA polymerase sigma-70 factor (ECF subfamily)